MLNGKMANGAEKTKTPLQKPKSHATGARAAGTRSAAAKTNGGHSLTVPMISAVPGSHEGSRVAAQP
jgi:hypothetical protein